MFKTLLVLCGVLAVSATGLQAQVRGAAHGGAMSAARPAFAARPSAYRGGYANRYHGGGGYYGHHHYGRYYYLGGIPFFYPYDYYGFGYPYYGFGAYGYGYGYGAYPQGDAVNNGSGDANDAQAGSGASLPEAVQRQLAKRGYYKGSIDGQFGPASKDALSRFQRKQGLKETGRIDEPTLDALGFTDHR